VGAFSGTADAQVAIPATPKEFTKRGSGNQGGGSAVVSSDGRSVTLGPTTPAPSAKARYVMHVTLCDPRQWTSTDGKALVGKLIAFEDMTVETEKGVAPPPMTPPPNPTVIKDGKARLLVDTKTYELPLDRPSPDDRAFVETVRNAVARQAGAAAK
jgi:hypothetical protein